MFRKKTDTIQDSSDRLTDFSYINADDIYLDSACQSLRPQPVIDSINLYYQTYNACGGRVKYKWGQRVDSEIEETRKSVIDYLGLPQKDYVCSFTLNTTYGINMILTQLPVDTYEQVITSEIEHNSVFLSTMKLADRLGVERKILKRDEDGNLKYNADDLKKSVVVVNSTSNIDGRLLLNIKQLISDTHKSGGIVIIDAAQTVAHHHELLIACDADAICFSAHKMYAASLGAIVIKKGLLQKLDLSFVGGGMVSSVAKQDFELLPDNMASWLEPGLQAYAEIISLKRAIDWLKNIKPRGMDPTDYIEKISAKVYHGLSQIPGVTMFYSKPTSVISLHCKNVDSHRLAVFLSAHGIMVRSGYFCCHYYLLEQLNSPPLLRFSIGLQTIEKDIEKTIEIMKKITKG